MDMTEFDAEFSAFLNLRIRPILEDALASRRGPLWRALAAGTAIAALAILTIWLKTYQGLAAIAEQTFSPALFIILSGCSFGSVVGVLVYILLLKRLMDRLRLILAAALGGFVDPNLSLEPLLPSSEWNRGRDLFPEELPGARFGEDLFRCVDGGLEMAFSEIWAPPAKEMGGVEAGGRSGRRIGIFLQARSASDSSASRDFSQAASEYLPGAPEGRSRRLLRRRDGGLVALVLLAADPGAPNRGRLSELNIENYREFCRDARQALEIARERQSLDAGLALPGRVGV